MDKYHIGTRLIGYSKDYIKSLMCEVSKKYNLNLEKRLVPHLTFLRPFTTKDESKIIRTFNKISSRYQETPIIYDVSGFGFFDNKEKIVYAKINSNKIIKNMITDLGNYLQEDIKFIGDKINLPNEENNINLHCTIAGKGINEFYKDILKFLKKQPFEATKHPLLRIYLLKNEFLLREYDFYLGKSLGRFDAINPFIFNETKKKFTEKTGIGITENGIIYSTPSLRL